MDGQRAKQRRMLRSTWNVFYGRYGQLLPIQEKSLSSMLNKRNAVLVSSTASGKTEAVIAPLVELMLRDKWASLSIVYITPTRALVNDICDRLKEQLSQLDVRLDRKTGDHPHLNYDRLPDILVTTPESLDSMICRHPEAFANLRALVLDEIHLLDNNYRGDQLRLLIRRLRLMIRRDLNVYCLSATIHSPQEVGTRYIDGDFDIITSEGGRMVHASYEPSLESALRLAMDEGIKKAIVFCNSRRGTEEAALLAKSVWKHSPVVVHHGSLSRDEREEVETLLKEWPSALCTATMTLEIGIDIGDIDGVVLADVPHSISSLMQRIGRGGRRTEVMRAICVYHSEDEMRVLELMIEASTTGALERTEYQPDYSVVVQQIMSILFSKPAGVERQFLEKVFEGFCSNSILDLILRELVDLEMIEGKFGKYYASTEVMDLGEKGKIHSNVPDSRQADVVDISTGQAVGSILLPVDDHFVLGGRAWKIKEITWGKVLVTRTESLSKGTRFKPNSDVGAFFDKLPDEVKEVVQRQVLNKKLIGV